MPIDPRATSEAKLQPPHPLPYVSRRALRRVKNPLPAPTQCPNCQWDVVLTTNADIYGREYGEWPYAYLCTNGMCDSYVGLHPDTDIPLGTLADSDLRESRKAAKAAFFARMRHQGMDRSAMYSWLATQMGIPVDECHFGWFDHAKCELAQRICEAQPCE